MATDKKDYTAADRVSALRNTGLSERDAILVSMKRTKKELKKDSSPEACCSPGGERDPYPYGLEISLEDEGLTKLGITELPKVGDIVKLLANAKVESVSQNERVGQSPSRTVRLQITDLCLHDSDEADEDDEEAGE